MSRLSIPATIQEAPAASRPLLEAVQQQLGAVPNLFRLVPSPRASCPPPRVSASRWPWPS